MHSITNHASLKVALTAAHGTLLADRLQAYAPKFVDPALKDQTHLIIVGTDCNLIDLSTELGFSPLLNPMDGVRYGSPDFHPYWDYLVQRPGWFEIIICIGTNFAVILLIADDLGRVPELLTMCREFAV